MIPGSSADGGQGYLPHGPQPSAVPKSVAAPKSAAQKGRDLLATMGAPGTMIDGVNNPNGQDRGIGSAVPAVCCSATATSAATCRSAFVHQSFARTAGHAHAAGAAGSVPSRLQPNRCIPDSGGSAGSAHWNRPVFEDIRMMVKRPILSDTRVSIVI